MASLESGFCDGIQSFIIGSFQYTAALLLQLWPLSQKQWCSNNGGTRPNGVLVSNEPLTAHPSLLRMLCMKPPDVVGSKTPSDSIDLAWHSHPW